MKRTYLSTFLSILFLLAVTACGGGGGGGGGSDPAPASTQPPVSTPDVAGTWEVTETNNDDCGDGNAPVTWAATVTQNGTSVTVSYGGVSRSGTMDGNTLSWSGSYPEEGGTTTVSSLTITFSGDSASGTATWSWTDGTDSCSGTTAISGERASTSGTTPAAPSGLSAVATSSGSIDLTWQDNADNEDAYILERSEVSSTNGFSVLPTLPADSQSFSDTGLSPSTTYYYRAASSNIEGQSAYTDVEDATTDAAPTIPPDPPSNLNGSATSSTSVNLFWTDSSDNESSFDIYKAVGPGGSFTLAQTVSANVTNATIDGLTPATSYAFKVIAVNAAGPSVDSNIHEITTLADDDPPEVPSELTVGNATSSSLTLNWTKTGDNETGFYVYRSSSQDGTYSKLPTSTTATSYTNTGLSASTTYWYKVSAYNNAGDSAQTAAVSGTTQPQSVTPPNAPTEPVVSNITSISATLSWTDNSDNESGFQIGTCTGLVLLGNNGALSCLTGFTQVAQVGANVTSYTFTGLSADTTYSHFVRAYNNTDSSANTGVKFTTALGPAADPSIVRIINDLASNPPWGDYNGLIRIRIGPSLDSVSSNNTELLTPYDSVPYDSAISLETLVPGQSIDFDVSGFTGEYYIYIEAGWWDLILSTVDFSPLWWEKTATNVFGCNGSTGYQKNQFIRIFPPFGDPEVVQVSDYLPMYDTWVGHPTCR